MIKIDHEMQVIVENIVALFSRHSVYNPCGKEALPSPSYYYYYNNYY